MSEKGILKKIDDIFNYCEEIDNHLPKEEQTGYRMLPDIFYIRKEVHNLQQKVEQLENIRKEVIDYIKDNACYSEGHCKCSFSQMALDNLLNILNKGENNE